LKQTDASIRQAIEVRLESSWEEYGKLYYHYKTLATKTLFWMASTYILLVISSFIVKPNSEFLENIDKLDIILIHTVFAGAFCFYLYLRKQATLCRISIERLGMLWRKIYDDNKVIAAIPTASGLLSEAAVIEIKYLPEFLKSRHLLKGIGGLLAFGFYSGGLYKIMLGLPMVREASNAESMVDLMSIVNIVIKTDHPELLVFVGKIIASSVIIAIIFYVCLSRSKKKISIVFDNCEACIKEA